MIYFVHFIIDAPVIAGQTTFSFKQGSTANLSCHATCIPHPIEVIWTRSKSDKPINLFINSRLV